MNKTYQRKFKNFLILPKFQIKLISYFITLFVLSTLCFYGVIYAFFESLKSKALQIGLPQGHVFFDYINGQHYDLNIFLFYMIIINFILLVVVGIIISHRIAGPIYKLKKFLSSHILDGETFNLRDKDFFKELEQTVNELTEKVSKND